jgi:16S rRNA (guanine966-N2)-methyltransferase
MRIITGQYKNRKIITETKHIKLDAKKIRPTTGKLRAAAFNILQGFFGGSHSSFMKDKRILDLCCGVGSFGLEALSRGAQEVCFVDNQPQHLELVRTTLEQIHSLETATVILANAQNLKKSEKFYDVVYLDPPYRCRVVGQIFDVLVSQQWINHDSILLVEHSAKELQHSLKPQFTLLEQRQYGASMLSYYKMQGTISIPY